MKVPRVQGSNNSSRRFVKVSVLLVTTLFVAAASEANTQLLLSREGTPDSIEYKGEVELTVNPGIDNARVSISVDGQPLADGLLSPYRTTVDFGPTAIEHKITVTVWSADKTRRVQWHQTLNRGMLPLRVALRPVDLASRTFEAQVTSPADDPVQIVELWDSGQRVASADVAPYRFVVPAEHFRSGFLEVTARTKSGDEAADFWSSNGDVHVESVEVRTVPIFVSVVDGNGQARDDVDRSLFRIMDNESEGKILEFGNAFDQPISIALLVDTSASMTYEIQNVTKAAEGFVQRALKQGDRCTVFAVRDVPRREVALTSDISQVEKVLEGLKPAGQTALYDAIGSAIRELKDEKNRRAVVVLTDGGDTSSNMGFDEIDKLATEAGIPLYFIAYDTGDTQEQQFLDRLNYLAGQTGGFVAAASKQNLVAKYREIEKDLRAQFAIRYQVTDYSKHNQWRKVRVVLNSPKLTARTIRGYYAP